MRWRDPKAKAGQKDVTAKTRSGPLPKMAETVVVEGLMSIYEDRVSDADRKEYNKYLFSVLGLGDDNVPVEIVHFGTRHGKGQTMARKKVPKFVLKINEIGSVKKAQLMSKGKPAGR